MKKSVLFLLLLVFTYGCSAQGVTPQGIIEQPKNKVVELKTLKMQMPNNISTIDPAFVETIAERQAATLIFEGLVKLDSETLKPVQGLAEKWDISADGKSYVFTLYPNLRFHNGNPIKASDVKFAWERIVYLNSPQKYMFSNILGYWEYVTGKRSDISGIRVLSDRILEIQLGATDRAFLLSLTQPAAAVVDRFQVLAKADRFGKPGTYTEPMLIPNGSGPYKAFDWIKDKSLTLGVNNKYHLSKSKIERIDIILENNKETNINDYILGSLDSIQNVSEADILNEVGLKGKLQTVRLAEFSYLRINPLSTSKTFSDLRVRKALMLAADFRRIGLYLNNDNLHYIPSGITDYLATGNIAQNETVVQNTYEASRLLTEAGYPGGKGLEFTLYYLNKPELKKVALLLKGQWSARGIRVYPVEVTSKELNTLKANKSAFVYLDKWTAPYPSVEAFYYPEFHSAFGNNISLEVDKLIADALFTQNENEQSKKFALLEKNLTQLYLLRPLLGSTATVLNKPWVAGLEANKLGLLTVEEANLNKTK